MGIIAADSQIDLAILKIQTETELSFLSFGDLAVVFGYPFDRESSMNFGIINCSGRSYAESASFDSIQPAPAPTPAATHCSTAKAT